MFPLVAGYLPLADTFILQSAIVPGLLYYWQQPMADTPLLAGLIGYEVIFSNFPGWMGPYLEPDH